MLVLHVVLCDIADVFDIFGQGCGCLRRKWRLAGWKQQSFGMVVPTDIVVPVEMPVWQW